MLTALQSLQHQRFQHQEDLFRFTSCSTPSHHYRDTSIAVKPPSTQSPAFSLKADHTDPVSQHPQECSILPKLPPVPTACSSAACQKASDAFSSTTKSARAQPHLVLRSSSGSTLLRCLRLLGRVHLCLRAGEATQCAFLVSVKAFQALASATAAPAVASAARFSLA